MKKEIKIIIVIIFIVILVLQISLRIYLGNLKLFFWGDEILSYILIEPIVNKDEHFDFNNRWNVKEEILNFFTCNKDEGLNLKQIFENQSLDQHPPIYYILLKILSNNFGVFTKWSGITLNIIIFAISNIILYLICNEIFKDKKKSILICFTYGFTKLSFFSTIFIRMYELTTLNLLILAYINIKIVKNGIDYKKCIIIAIATIIGILTHYYYIIYAGFSYLIYVIICLRENKKKSIFKYIITLLISYTISLIIFPSILRHIFIHEVGKSTINNFWMGINGEKIKQYIKFIDNGIFTNKIIYVIITMIILVIILKIKEKNRLIVKLDNSLLILTAPAIMYFIIIAQITPYIEERFIYPIVPFIVIGFLHCLERLIKKTLKKEVILYAFAILLVTMNIKTGIQETKLTYNFYERDKIENINQIPYIYVYDESNDNRIKQIGRFIISDKSYILNESKAEKSNLNNIIEQVDITNGILIYFDCEDSEKYIEMIKELNKFNEIEVLLTEGFWGRQTYYFKK